MVPIYAVNSWLSLKYKDTAVYLDMFRDCYEAYVIYLFLALMVSLLGGGNEYRIVEIMEDLPRLQHPYPFNYIWPPIELDATFLRKCKLGTMQFVVIKPLMTIIAAFLESWGLYEQGVFRMDRGYAYVVFVQNISISVAFYFLALFYIALKPFLKPFNPVPKFICIKAVLFLSFWQGVLIAALARFHFIKEMGSWTVENVATGTNNLLLCFEMLLAAIAHCYAFPYEPYKKTRPGALGRNLLPDIRNMRLRDNFAIDDAVNDFNEVMPGRILLPSGFRPGAATIINHAAESEGRGTNLSSGSTNQATPNAEQGKTRMFVVENLRDYAEREEENFPVDQQDDEEMIGWRL